MCSRSQERFEGLLDSAMTAGNEPPFGTKLPHFLSQEKRRVQSIIRCARIDIVLLVMLDLKIEW